jgi:hypothetical protein
MPGEIAEMMLDGTLCEACGVALEGIGNGYPRYCSDGCARDRGAIEQHQALQCRPGQVQPSKPERARWRRTQTEPLTCPFCGFRRKTTRALADHMRDSHQARMTIETITTPETSNGN